MTLQTILNTAQSQQHLFRMHFVTYMHIHVVVIISFYFILSQTTFITDSYTISEYNVLC